MALCSSSGKGKNTFALWFGKCLADRMQGNCKRLLLYTQEQKLADLTFPLCQSVTSYIFYFQHNMHALFLASCPVTSSNEITIKDMSLGKQEWT